MEQGHFEQVKNCPLFNELQSEELNQLEKVMNIIHLNSGDTLFERGDPSDSIYILLSGRLIAMTGDGSNSEKILGEINRGESVGEMGLLSDTVRSATVKALRNSTLYKIDEESFHQLLAEDPDLLKKISKTLISRMQTTIHQIGGKHFYGNIALVPANKGIDVNVFMDALEKVFDDEYKYKVLNKDFFEKNYVDATNERAFFHDLEEIDELDDFVFYVADLDNEHWFDICFERADRILVIGDGYEKPNLHPKVDNILQETGLHSNIKKELVLLQPEFRSMPIGTKEWLELGDFFRHHHIRLSEKNDLKKLLRFLTGRALGFVFGGGGAKDWAAMGVVRYLYEKGIRFDMLGGTSAGSIAACFLAYKQDFDSFYDPAYEYMSKLNLKEYTIPSFSAFSGKSLTLTLQAMFEETLLEDYWTNVFCVATNISRVREQVFQSGKAWEIIRASSSIPGALPPMVFDHDLYVDGAVMNNLPIDVMQVLLENRGYTLAIDVSEQHVLEDEYVIPSIVTPWMVIKNKLGLTKPPWVAPKILSSLVNSLLAAAEFKNTQNAEMADLCLRPPVSHISMLNMSELNQLHDIGYNTMREEFDKYPWLMDYKI